MAKKENKEPYRASGDCICKQCGKKFYDHPLDKENTDWDGNPFLNILCNGDLVKL